MPPDASPCEPSEIAERGWNLLDEDLSLPAAVLREDALEHNGRWMRRFLAESGARLCPHGKTSMAPELFRRQLREGAWGITVATMRQLGVCRRHGVDRVLLANQIVRGDSVRWVAGELERDPAFDFYALVDSVPGVERLAQALAGVPGRRPLQLLVEVGHEHGRAGCRSRDEALEVARAIRRSDRLALKGVEGFEGILGKEAETAREAVTAYLDDVVEVAETLGREGTFAEGEVLVTAGGSAFFDLVLDRFSAADLDGRARVVLRSGCYLTHDAGLYRRAFRDLLKRSSRARGVGSGFRPALEIWSYVQSRPEPGRAILTMGKRDCSFDIELPTPERLFRPGRDRCPRELEDACRITALDDQHAYLELPREMDVRIGDMIGCGISHPCTTFDRWRMLALIDEDYNVTGAVHTEF